MLSFFVICFLISALNAATVEEYQCKDQNAKSVDWYVLYKLPRNFKSDNSLIQQGLAYLYITSETFTNGWTLSNVSINDSKSIPGYTLTPLYNDSSSIHILYNDEPPYGPTSGTDGHTKGVIISNNKTGLWLIHSVPHYPFTSNYLYPKTGVHYGQSFLCISIDINTINTIGKQLQYNEPYLYSHNIPNGLESFVPDLIKAVENERIITPPWFSTSEIHTLNGEKFVSFAKNRKFGSDIYEKLVAQNLKSDLYVESWLNGPGKLSSDCSHVFSVYNVKNISFNQLGVKFSSSLDHSKWAVSQNMSTKSSWICIGDINRAERQETRGGGTVCLNHKVANNYRKIVKDVETCKRQKISV